MKILRVRFKPTASIPNSWRTPTNLCNRRFIWIALAQQKPDYAAQDACNATDNQQDWRYHIADEQILAQLLNLNLRRAVKGGITTMGVHSGGIKITPEQCAFPQKISGG